MRSWRNERIEARAEERLAQLASSLGRPLSLPVPVDLVIEHVLDSDVLWDVSEERPGEMIPGAIDPPARQVVIKENHADLVAQRPGLERFTRLHEGGHRDLLTDRAAIDHPDLPGRGDVNGSVSFRQSRSSLLQVLKALCMTKEGIDYVCGLRSRSDDPYDKRVGNSYAGAVLMPTQLLREHVARRRPRRWPAVYRLAERYEVTPTGMKVRRNELGLVCIDESGTFYGSKAGPVGHQLLFE